MRRTMRKTIALAAIWVGFVATTARAGDFAKVSIPFPFVVGHDRFPAGTYDVRTSDDDPNVVVLDGVSGTKAHAFIATRAEYERNPGGHHPTLKFTRDGSDYRLMAVWETGDYARDVLSR